MTTGKHAVLLLQETSRESWKEAGSTIIVFAHERQDQLSAMTQPMRQAYDHWQEVPSQ